jgi:hypothetical protein
MPAPGALVDWSGLACDGPDGAGALLLLASGAALGAGVGAICELGVLGIAELSSVDLWQAVKAMTAIAGASKVANLMMYSFRDKGDRCRHPCAAPAAMPGSSKRRRGFHRVPAKAWAYPRLVLRDDAVGTG